jgi:ADP-L-glycero-D-manno-heptose 6-epimerase
MIIITGGAGFIGSCLAAAIEKAKLGPIVICDWLGNGQKWRNLAGRTLDDIITPEQLFPFLDANQKRVDMIYHLGAISATTETDGEKIVANNFRLSKDLFQWCADKRKRIVYASSAATYGDGAQGFDDKEDLSSLKKLQPLNLYGWSKHAFDQFVTQTRDTGEKFPAQCAGLKFFNVYGPNEYHKDNMRSVVHQIFPVAQRGEAFSLFKSHHPDYIDGGQLRDFIWVQDCVDVMLWLYHHPRVNGLYNVGTGKARSFLDLAKAVYVSLGKEPNITYRDMPEHIRGQYQYFTQANMSKLKTAGYNKEFTSIEDGVGAYVKEYLAKSDPYC